MAEQGRLKLSLALFVKQVFPGIDYRAQYPGRLVAQNGQLFDFQPDSPKVPGIQGLPFYSGTPGVEITVDFNQSPRAVLYFRNGVPAGAALALFENPGLATFKLTAETEIDVLAPLVKVGNAATLAAARVTDPVAAATSMASFITAVIAAFAGNSGVPVTIPPPTDFGVISAGSSEVVIG